MTQVSKYKYVTSTVYVNITALLVFFLHNQYYGNYYNNMIASCEHIFEAKDRSFNFLCYNVAIKNIRYDL